MADAKSWALFGQKAQQMAKGLRKEGTGGGKHKEHKEESQPAEVAHGEDNTDKTADELQRGEEVPQARIVAYSDSDEEDFNRHKWQPGTESDSEDEHRASPVDVDTATVNVKQKQLIRQPPPGNKVSIGSGPGIAAVADFCGHHVAPNMHKALVPQNAIRVMVLGVLRRTQPKTANLLEQLSLALALPMIAVTRLGMRDKLPALPAGIAVAGEQLRALALPAAVIHIGAHLWRLWLIRKKRRRKPARAAAASQANLDGPDSEDQASTSQHQQPPPLQQQQQLPQLEGGGGGRAARAAQQYPMEVAEMRHRLRAAGAQLPVQRFSDAELLRYGYACGLLKAQTANAKADCTEQAVLRIRSTLEWLKAREFMTPTQMHKWDHLVRWQGRDAEGRPLLVVRVAQACQECSSTAAEELSQVIVSLVARAVELMLGDEEGQAEQMVAVLDARQATTLQVTRKVNLIKQLALDLNQHYPARLHQLYLVDLPVVLKWVVSAVKPVLQPESWGKIQVCQLPSPLFPFPAALLDFSVSQKRVSLPSTAPSKMPQQQGVAGEQGSSQGSREVRRTMSVPDLAPRLGRSPRRRHDRLMDSADDVQGLGKGVKRRIKKRNSSKAIAIQADSQLPVTSLQNTSTGAVAAITLLFTFMVAICQRLMGQAFGLAQPAGRTPNT
ncbi:hypothetical protein ABBQ38_013893 [Trebouxia sp. C0009 RCD-2024]